ncbi:MAG: G5 domain-containing protein [Anaerolineales bacterium]
MRLYHYYKVILFIFVLALVCAGCIPSPVSPPQREINVEIVADQETYAITVPAGSTVGDALQAADVTLEGKDRVEPSTSTVLEENSTLRVIRVEEEFETEEQVMPYEVIRQSSESLPEGEEQLLQAGKNGLRKVTYVRVLENGEEVAYEEVNSVVVEEPVDEIVLVGVQSSISPLTIPGRLVYLSDGNAWMMETSTANRTLVVATGDLDGRIFSLSEDGRWLLFTRQEAEDEDVINSLWAVNISSEEEELVDLGVENIIHFGDWVPGAEKEIAYSTVEPRVSSPGWQANNDLILRDFAPDGFAEGETLVETNYGGVYGWWGTDYALTPTGEVFVYSSPDRVGLIDRSSGEKKSLMEVIPYKTRGDWAWMPGLGMGSNGRILYTVDHVPLEGAGAVEESPLFNLVAVPLDGGQVMTLAREVGMFAYPKTSPVLKDAVSESAYQVAYLQAIFPQQSSTSSYRVTLMDRDGSNKKVLFPALEDAGLEPSRGWGAWAPEVLEGEDSYLLAVLYQGNIWVVNTASGQFWPATGDGRVQRMDWQ